MVLAGEKSVKFRKIYRNEGGFIAVILDKKDLILIDTGEDLKRWTIEAHQRMDIALVAVIELSNIDLGILLIEHMLVVLGPLGDALGPTKCCVGPHSCGWFVGRRVGSPPP